MTNGAVCHHDAIHFPQGGSRLAEIIKCVTQRCNRRNAMFCEIVFARPFLEAVKLNVWKTGCHLYKAVKVNGAFFIARKSDTARPDDADLEAVFAVVFDPFIFFF